MTHIYLKTHPNRSAFYWGGQVDIQHLLADKIPLEMIPTAFWTLPSCAVVEYFKSGLSLTRGGLTRPNFLHRFVFFTCGKPHCARPLQRLCGCFPFGFVVAARVGVGRGRPEEPGAGATGAWGTSAGGGNGRRGRDLAPDESKTGGSSEPHSKFG